jgi:hypothetical protein
MNDDLNVIASANKTEPMWWRRPHTMAVLMQAFLVAMAVLGQVDFGRQMVAYLTEGAIAMLLSILCYSRTWRSALGQLPPLFGTIFIALFMILMIPMFIKTQGNFIAFSAMLDNAKSAFGGSYLPITLFYCFANFTAAWVAARRTPDARHTFFVDTVYPGSMSIESIGATILVGFIASAMFSGLTDWHPSHLASRIFSIALVVVCCLLRQGLGYVMLDIDAANATYHSLQQS